VPETAVSEHSRLKIHEEELMSETAIIILIDVDESTIEITKY
jgi:hypothetical protein